MYKSPATSHLEACRFVISDLTAQLCLRIVQWLEGLASEALDLEKKVRGCHVGSYLPSSGVWRHTQRLLKKGKTDTATVQHLDFDAPTREAAELLPDDKKQDESLLEDIWVLLKAGRLEEACELCRSAGQVCEYVYLLLKVAEQDGGKYETAVHAAQCSNLKRVLPICTDWERRLVAYCIMVLIVLGIVVSKATTKVDLELAHFQPGRLEGYVDALYGSCEGEEISQPSIGAEVIWYMKQYLEHVKNITGKLRPHGDPQMIRFGAHLVLIIRYLLSDDMKDAFKEKLATIGDRIIHMYSMFLFSKQHEELVGIYASQLARHLCIDLFVHMMELRLNDRVLSTSREIKSVKSDGKLSNIAEQHRLQSLQKAMAIQWLCFTPPSTINDSEPTDALQSNELDVSENLQEFEDWSSLFLCTGHKTEDYCGGWTAKPGIVDMGAQEFRSNLEMMSRPVLDQENKPPYQKCGKLGLARDYYSCDATYRNWLKVDLENAEVPPADLSVEERERAIAAARETLNSLLSLLLRKKTPWLTIAQSNPFESADLVFIELHAKALLCLPSGDCMPPDATSCTTLTSALYSLVSEEEVLKHQLMGLLVLGFLGGSLLIVFPLGRMTLNDGKCPNVIDKPLLQVNVSISARDNYCVEVVLRCLAENGDGLGPHEPNDGGLLATIMAAAFKVRAGELPRFQAGVTLEISCLDAWYSDAHGSLMNPATYVVRGLCRRCCLPELVLRCMQLWTILKQLTMVSVSLVMFGDFTRSNDEVIELVASSESGLIHLFSQQQLQREYSIAKMELQEELSMEES
ncbi:hypothetical protein ACLOJK_000997 [Asimina triloba]